VILSQVLKVKRKCERILIIGLNGKASYGYLGKLT